MHISIVMSARGRVPRQRTTITMSMLAQNVPCANGVCNPATRATGISPRSTNTDTTCRLDTYIIKPRSPSDRCTGYCPLDEHMAAALMACCRNVQRSLTKKSIAVEVSSTGNGPQTGNGGAVLTLKILIQQYSGNLFRVIAGFISQAWHSAHT